MRVIAANAARRTANPILCAEVGTPRGTLRVALPASLARQYVVPALHRFAVQHPDVKILAILADGDVDLVRDGIDVALCIGPVDERSFAARRVSEAAFVTCASPDYLDLNGVPRTPAELDGHDCLGLFSIARGGVMEWVFEKNGKRITFVPEDHFAMNDGEALVSAAASGAGIVTVLDVVAKRSIASGMLCPILTDWQPAQRYPISIVYPQHRQFCAEVRAFSDFVAGLFPGKARTLRTESMLPRCVNAL